jgi:tetratricopeptide (TPR) repeat protein
MFRYLRALYALVLIASPALAQEAHDHGVPEKLGDVSFPISCAPSVQPSFNRAVALLHSFAYAPAEQAFQAIAQKDPHCAMAYWGLAMVHFHPVWSPSLPPASFGQAQRDMQRAVELGAASDREKGFISAGSVLFQATPGLKANQRTKAYEQAMEQVASDHPTDMEAQVFYALALLSNASPADKTHAKQKHAVAILEPLFRAHPDHPGLAHYMIHACDSEELAKQGLPAARVYAKIAPSAPHALHMPSHIFTRLGLWDDSVHSNLASKESAHQHGDTMGEFHAMDYLVYAYLQEGKDGDAQRVVDEMKAMRALDVTEFAIAYAATIMPIRIAVERGRWSDAAEVAPMPGASPPILAIAVWSKGIGLARSGHPADAGAEVTRLRQLEKQLRDSGDDYWATQTAILADEVAAWQSQATGHADQARSLLQFAADREESLEKRPVTPGPALPAREQLGELLLLQGDAAAAREAYRAALIQAPGRRGAVLGEARAGQAMR